MKRQKPSVISLFSGALGLDLGLESAGFQVRVAVECDRFAVETIKANKPKLPVINRPVEDVPTEEILTKAGLLAGEPTLVTGGPCCQSFSTAGLRGSLSDPRGNLFQQFVRIIKESRPRFFVMENVKGILSAAVLHRPLNQRGPGFPALKPDEELGSAFKMILSELKKTGYYVSYDLLNAADFGVPQVRERLVFIGSRDGESISMPSPTHGVDPETPRKPWVTLKASIGHLVAQNQSFSTLPASKLRFMRLVPEGGNWRDLEPCHQKKAMGGALQSWGGRSGFFRRLSWNRPAPALTTRPDSKATMLCHPSETRPLSIEEYACIQQFPEGWKFSGGIPQKYKQIGNAVPVGLGEAIGQAIVRTMKSRSKKRKTPDVVCDNPELIRRMKIRPRTILNPPHMRQITDLVQTRAWCKARQKQRAPPKRGA